MTHAQENPPRDDGTDQPSGAPADRPAGTSDPDADLPLDDPDDDTTHGGTRMTPPQDDEVDLPPDDERP